jgi:RNA polymerase sigma-70 factor, ECF subfamily
MTRERGAPHALEGVFRVHYRPLVRTLSPVHGYDAAAEAVQDAFVEAYRRWRRIEHYDDPVAWIRRVALNRLLNRRRDETRRARPSARGVGALSPPQTDEVADRRIDVVAALAQLTPRQRAFVGLYYFGDWSVQAIATELRVSEGTVKATVHQARHHLALILGGAWHADS